MKLFAIGDIHGEYDLLVDLLAQMDSPEPTTIVFLGDYIDRGPKSRQVLELLIRGPDTPNHTWIALKGNHEDLCLEDARNWAYNGAEQTMQSYPNYPNGSMPQEHKDWMRKLPFYYETEHHIFVHAGFAPHTPLEKQDGNVMMWIRDLFLFAEKGFDGWKHIVHGHTPTRGTEYLSWRTNLDSGAYHFKVLTGAEFAGPGGPIRVLEAKG